MGHLACVQTFLFTYSGILVFAWELAFSCFKTTQLRNLLKTVLNSWLSKLNVNWTRQSIFYRVNLCLIEKECNYWTLIAFALAIFSVCNCQTQSKSIKQFEFNWNWAVNIWFIGLGMKEVSTEDWRKAVGGWGWGMSCCEGYGFSGISVWGRV